MQFFLRSSNDLALMLSLYIMNNETNPPCVKVAMFGWYNNSMYKLKENLRRFIYRVQHEYFSMSNVVEIIALIICLWFAFGTINAMSRNWQLKQKLQERKIEQARLEIEVEKLKLEQQYYETEEYHELLARSKGNKMADGETMVILPRNSEEAINKHNESNVATVVEKSNFEQWLDFLFR